MQLSILIVQQTSPEFFIGTLVVIGLFLLVGAIIVNLDNSKKKKESKNWENTESTKDTLEIPKLFDSLIEIVSNETPVCTKCGNKFFQFWELYGNTLEIRCTTCKKKISVSVEDNFTLLCSAYINYVQSAYSQENVFIKEKMIKRIKFDFVGLRKGTPLIRAIEFIAKGKETKINEVRQDDKDS